MFCLVHFYFLTENVFWLFGRKGERWILFLRRPRLFPQYLKLVCLVCGSRTCLHLPEALDLYTKGSMFHSSVQYVCGQQSACSHQLFPCILNYFHCQSSMHQVLPCASTQCLHQLVPYILNYFHCQSNMHQVLPCISVQCLHVCTIWPPTFLIASTASQVYTRSPLAHPVQYLHHLAPCIPSYFHCQSNMHQVLPCISHPMRRCARCLWPEESLLTATGLLCQAPTLTAAPLSTML